MKTIITKNSIDQLNNRLYISKKRISKSEKKTTEEMILVAQRSREMKKFQRQVKIYQEKTERLKHIGVCVCVTVYTYSSNFNLGKEGE